MKCKKLIVASLLGCMILSGCGSEKLADNMGNDDGNITNLGNVCQKGNTVYYQNDKDNFSIYKSVNGKTGVKLNDGTSYFINVVGDYVYYVSENNDFHIYRMKTDGSDNKEIVKQRAYYMTVYGDYIYYIDYDQNQAIYRAKTDGSEPTKIVDSQCYYPIIAEDKLYYVDYSNEGKVTQADLDGSNSFVLDENNYITGAYLNYYDGKLYYVNAVTEQSPNKGQGYDNFLMSYNLETGTVGTVIEEPCADINIRNGIIYYSSLTDSKVYSCNLKGENKKLVYDNNGIFLNLTDDDIYCFVKIEKQDPYIEKVSIKPTLGEKLKSIFGDPKKNRQNQ